MGGSDLCLSRFPTPSPSGQAARALVPALLTGCVTLAESLPFSGAGLSGGIQAQESPVEVGQGPAVDGPPCILPRPQQGQPGWGEWAAEKSPEVQCPPQLLR